MRGAHVSETRAWKKIEYLSESPGVRENNGVVEHDRCLYLFGGYNGSEWLNDFWQFNLGAWRHMCRAAACAQCPCPVYRVPWDAYTLPSVAHHGMGMWRVLTRAAQTHGAGAASSPVAMRPRHGSAT